MSTLGYIGLFSLVVVIVVLALFVKDHELGLKRTNRRTAELERRVDVLVSRTGISTADVRPVPQQDEPKKDTTFCD